MASYCAPVMGCSYLGGATAADDLKSTAAITKQLFNIIKTVIQYGREQFTSSKAANIQTLFNQYKTAIDNLATNYPDTDFSKIDPAATKSIQYYSDRIIKYLDILKTWDTTAGALWLTMRQDKGNAIAQGNLDHPLIPHEEKMNYISLAYGRLKDAAKFDPIRATYNQDGTRKDDTAVTPVTRENVLQEISQRYQSAGITRPEPWTPGVSAAPASIPGGMNKGVIAAIAAGAVAFLALKG